MIPLEEATSSEAAANETKAGNRVISTEQIVCCIAKLKAAVDWPKEVTAPAFNDEAATIYLNILPKYFKPCDSKAQEILRLPHPLSLNRNVCYIGEDIETKTQRAENKKTLREAGVLGKIKIIPGILVQTAIADDLPALTQKLDTYDSLLLCEKTANNTLIFPPITSYLEKKMSLLLEWCKDLKSEFAKTLLSSNSAANGFVVAVGHTGLTDEQLEENILAAVNYVDSQLDRIFILGLDSVQSIQLKTGTSEGVPLYQHIDSIEDISSKRQSALTISEGITALKASADWPKTSKTPAYSDEASTVFLEVPFTGHRNIIVRRHCLLKRLPHPLSLNRSVCYVSNETTEEQEALNTNAFKALGVTGEIKMLPADIQCKMLLSEDQSAWNQLAAQFDTHITSVRLPIAIDKLAEFRKLSIVPENKDFMAGLQKTAMWMNSAGNAYFMAVGHSGLTDEQLEENIAAAVKCVDWHRDKFTYRYIESMRIRIGSSKGVDIQMAVPADNAVAVDVQGPAVKFAKALAAMRAATDWPMKPKTTSFNNEDGILYLSIVPEMMMERLIPHCTQIVQLKHPLSLNRRVCYVSQDNFDDQDCDVTRKLRDLGIQGKIKMIPKSLLNKAVYTKNEAALDQLANLYDTYFACPFSHTKMDVALGERLAQRNKFCIRVQDEQFENKLAFSALWPNSAKSGYEIAVGYSGLTDKQIKENISAVLKYVDSSCRALFPNGLASVEAFFLKTGTTEEMKVCLDDLAVMANQSLANDPVKTKKVKGPKKKHAAVNPGEENQEISIPAKKLRTG